MKYSGLLIERHTLQAPEQKAEQVNSLYGWWQVELTAEEWCNELSAGRTIQPSEFVSVGQQKREADKTDEIEDGDDEKFTHSVECWRRTYFVCCDADNIKGVEFTSDRKDKNPEGVAPWTDSQGLSKLYPDLKDKVYAVGQSISSMTEFKGEPHRRYRLIFLFDAPIESAEHYNAVLLALAKAYPIIPAVTRSPAQPVMGNAREGFGVHVCGNILKLSDYPVPSPVEPPPKKESTTAPTESLQEFLDRHHVSYTPADKPNKFYVECHNKERHSKTGPTDSYCFDDGRAWSFHCSHATCQQSGQSTWEAFKRGFGIETKPPRDESADLLQRVKWEPDEIDVSEDEEQMTFPSELFSEIEPFGLFRDAHLDRMPISDAYCFAGLKHIITSLLGRKIYIKSSPPVYANFFTALVGNSSDAAKGNALKQAREMLEASDPNVYALSGLATPEGFLEVFVDPKGLEDEEGGTFYRGGFAKHISQEFIQPVLDAKALEESIRVSGFFGEFGSVLRKASKQNSQGMLEMLMQIYDAERSVSSPTKVDPTIAWYPAFSMIAATDKRLIEGVLKDQYIAGGFTNRFEWYLGEAVEQKFLNDEVDQQKWNACVNLLGSIRNKFGSTKAKIAFEVSEAAKRIGQAFTDEFQKELQSEDLADTMIADSLKRTRMHILKNALIFAAVLNEPNNRMIDTKHVILALSLVEFTVDSTKRIFSDFATSMNKQVEDKILRYLRKKPKSTLADIAGRTRTDLQTVEKAMDTLVRNHVVLAENGARKVRYSAIRIDAQ